MVGRPSDLNQVQTNKSSGEITSPSGSGANRKKSFADMGGRKKSGNALFQSADGESARVCEHSQWLTTHTHTHRIIWFGYRRQPSIPIKRSRGIFKKEGSYKHCLETKVPSTPTPPTCVLRRKTQNIRHRPERFRELNLHHKSGSSHQELHGWFHVWCVHPNSNLSITGGERGGHGGEIEWIVFLLF